MFKNSEIDDNPGQQPLSKDIICKKFKEVNFIVAEILNSLKEDSDQNVKSKFLLI